MSGVNAPTHHPRRVRGDGGAAGDKRFRSSSSALLFPEGRAPGGGRVLACGSSTGSVVPVRGANALIGAARLAYRHRLPLALSPDVVAVTIAQGLTTSAADDHEVPRVRHDGLVKSEPRGPWASLLPALHGPLARHPAVLRMPLSAPGTDIVADVAFDLAPRDVVDVVDGVVDREGGRGGGIPSLLVLGEARRWSALHDEVVRWTDVRHASWQRALVPVLDALRAAAEGVDIGDELREPYRARHASADDDAVTGWLARLFPSVVEPPTGARHEDAALVAGGRDAPRPDDMPSSLRAAPWVWLVDDAAWRLRVVAGVAGATWLQREGALAPVLGWALVDDEG